MVLTQYEHHQNRKHDTIEKIFDGLASKWQKANSKSRDYLKRLKNVYLNQLNLAKKFKKIRLRRV